MHGIMVWRLETPFFESLLVAFDHSASYTDHKNCKKVFEKKSSKTKTQGHRFHSQSTVDFSRKRKLYP